MRCIACTTSAQNELSEIGTADADIADGKAGQATRFAGLHSMATTRMQIAAGVDGRSKAEAKPIPTSGWLPDPGLF